MRASEERRRKPRAVVDLGVRFKLDGQSGTARVRDISGSGVMCTTDRALPLMTQVALVLVLPGDHGRREIVCSGAVVRSGPSTRPAAARSSSFDTAIFFTELLDSDRVEIEEYVSSSRR